MLHRLPSAKHVRDAFLRPSELVRQPAEARLGAISLPELLLGGLCFVKIPECVSRKPERPALFGDRLLQGLPYPRMRPGQEWCAAQGVIALDRTHDPERNLLLEIVTTYAATLVPAREATQTGIRELDAACSRVVIACGGGIGRALDARVVIHASRSLPEIEFRVDSRRRPSIGKGERATNQLTEVDAMASRVRADGLLDDLDAISEQMSRALGLRAATNGGSRGWLPPVDIWETQDELVIEIDAPGCDPQDLAAEVVDNQLVVSGERTLTETAARRYRSERWHGRFVRTFIVPPGVDNASIKAEYGAGVLRLRVPKPEQAKPRRITIAGERNVIDVPRADESAGTPSS